MYVVAAIVHLLVVTWQSYREVSQSKPHPVELHVPWGLPLTRQKPSSG